MGCNMVDNTSKVDQSDDQKCLSSVNQKIKKMGWRLVYLSTLVGVHL